MTHDYKNVIQNGADVVVAGIKHFDLAQTLDNGQAFRWQKITDNCFSGIAHGRFLEVELTDENLVLKSTTLEAFENIWRNYFDLGSSYTLLREKFSEHNTMADALAFSPGLRLMRQDAWEMLVSFILSQNSNIPRIKKMISSLCESYGEKLENGFAFPTAEKLAQLTVEDLSIIKSGYRAAYIIDAARQVASGELDLTKLSLLPTEEVRAALLKVHGVGPKVADCVLLFGFARTECFPLDVWMKRVMEKLYPSGFPTELNDIAGIAQQFLFHYARVHGLDCKH